MNCIFLEFTFWAKRNGYGFGQRGTAKITRRQRGTILLGQSGTVNIYDNCNVIINLLCIFCAEVVILTIDQPPIIKNKQFYYNIYKYIQKETSVPFCSTLPATHKGRAKWITCLFLYLLINI